MATFSNCLQIVNAMPQRDQDALLARLDELQAQGMSPKEAQLQAAVDVLAQVEREGEIRKSASRVTDTPAFKRWFGDSKVVDENGEPRVMYHGTTGEIDVVTGDVFWVTPIKELAATLNGGKRKVEAVYVKASSIFDPSNEDHLNRVAPALDKMLQRTSLANGRWKQAIQWSWSLWDSAKARQAIADAGFDAIKSEEDGNPTLALIGDVEGRVKSASGNNGDFNPDEPSIFKSVERPEFYSQLQRSIEQVPERLATMAAPAWKQWLTANAPKLGVKAEEVEWSGIKDYLDLQGKTKLSKDDLAAYLDESGVKISEVVLAKEESGMSVDDWLESWAESNPGETADAILNGEPWDTTRKIARENGDTEVLDRIDRKIFPSKYDQYTLPGGENYRELLITLPEKAAAEGEIPAGYKLIDTAEEDRADGINIPADATGPWRFEGPSVSSRIYKTRDEALAALLQEAKSEEQNGLGVPGRYRSSHWDEPNVLAHIRVNDRTDADGKRVLFVEEIQSDWGQEGKKKGFGPKEAAPLTRAEIDEQMALYDLRSNRTPEQTARMLELTERESASQGKHIPAAPFVTKTEGWLNLALKRIAMMAVEGGYDKVAFVNGEQSADRYDLSKQIQSISYDPKEKILDAWDQNRRKVMRREITDESQLEDYVGKEVAKRLLATEPVMGKHLLDGEDIKVGGEGMKTFYDKIVPQAINKLLPKLGGEKLSTVNIGNQGDEWGVYDSTDEENAGLYSRHATRAEADAAAKEFDGGVEVRRVTDAADQPGFDVTDKMRETVGAGVPLFSRDRTQTPEFKKWFGDSKIVNEDGSPKVMYHGTGDSISVFSKGWTERGAYYFTPDAKFAEGFAIDAAEKIDEDGYDEDRYGKMEAAGANIVPVYLSVQNPFDPRNSEHVNALIDEAGLGGNPAIREIWFKRFSDGMYDDLESYYEDMKALGFDGFYEKESPDQEYWNVGVFESTQIKSATGNNGKFSSKNPDIRKSADRPWFEDLSKLKVTTNYQLGDLLKTSKKLSWWDRTVGTQYNLAQKHPEFKRVFDAVQTFINDVSAYATRAADMAQDILPKLETWRDIGKAPLSAADVKALRDPVFGGTLSYTRDEEGNIVETDDVQKAGVVFTDEELRSRFNLTDKQIDLYRQFRKAADQSITDLALSDMLRYLGDDGADIREQVMAAGNVDVAVGIIKSHLEDLAASEPKRAYLLGNITSDIEDKAEQANRLMDRGYAPLSRFGQYTVYAVGQDGEQIYFSMFENERDANKMAREMREQYPEATVTTGTMSQESYKLFSGVTPETLALFGEALGLEESGIDTKSEAYQTMLKVAKTNRSAMKRLIQRKGIDGFSEDAGRVLAGFVYSNARQISTNLHAGAIGKAASDVKDGDVKDQAVRLMEYIQNPQEEAQAIRGLLFTQFIGGSVASAMVNMTQPFTMTLPYLSQFGGASKAGKAMADALKLISRGIRNDDDLKQALKRAEDEGVVSPQEVHQLMAQAQGKGQLQSGDGTRIGDAMAKTNNFMAKVGLGWGKLFSAAEQFNRRITFIAAYKMAREQGIDNPFAFAEKAIAESQGVYNKGNKPNWARGAVGGTLFTFKQYSIAYVEFLRRMWGNGPEGKKAVGLALAVLFMTAGLGGMPGADDLDDVIDGFAQRVLGKSFDSKQAKKEFFASILGQTGAEFVMGGLTGIPGAPIDLSGRMGLGNLIPGTGILTKKKDYGRDVSEVFGPAGTFFSNIASAAGSVAQGEIGKAAESLSPVAIQNVIKATDMATMGMYRDQKGRKVIDVDGWEAAVKALGFQPGSVKRVQDATSTQQGLIAQNKLRETEIADKWAAGRIERNPAKVEEAKAELAEWNRKNPQSPISIDAAQINRRVQQAMMDKAKRLEKTAPKEIRQTVRQELERAN